MNGDYLKKFSIHLNRWFSLEIGKVAENYRGDTQVVFPIDAITSVSDWSNIFIEKRRFHRLIVL